MNWNMARNTEKMKNENCTLQDLEYFEKTDKRGKEKPHSRTRNMARNTEKEEKKKHKRQDLEYSEKQWNTRNTEKYRLQYLDFGDKTENCGK